MNISRPLSVQVSRALPERRLEIEALLRELESLQGRLDELSAWASGARAKLEQSPEEPPPKVADVDDGGRCVVRARLLCFHCFVSPQLVEEVQAKQPEVEFVLERADQLYKDGPPSRPDRVRRSNGEPK